MDKLIQAFPEQLAEGLQLGKDFKFSSHSRTVSNVVISGLGGSGIGGTIVENYSKKYVNTPVVVNKTYELPHFVNNDTLVIICSYSGNTEETISCLQEAIQKKSVIVCITSGGKIADIAQQHQLDYMTIPAGNPPRACLGYSLLQILFAMLHYNLIDNSFIHNFGYTIDYLKNEENNLKLQAKQLAEKIKNKMPIIYTEDSLEGVAVRWRQQINENAKQLCWHHVVPEMNHNELVGWRQRNDDLIAVFLRSDLEHGRNHIRMEINKEIIAHYCYGVEELQTKTDNYWEACLILIYIGDWLSYYMAINNAVDPIEVKVIDYLKNELSKK